MDLDELRRLAGIIPSKGYTPYQGSNISVTGNEKGEIMKAQKIQPGTDDWFSLWFARPYLTGEHPGGFRGRKK